MAIPALPGVSGSDKLRADRASNVIEGVISGVGPGKAFSAWGAMNLVAFGRRTVELTTTAGSDAATVDSATGLAAGASIKSDNVPPGTTVGVLSGTDVTLAFPPQYWEGTLTKGLAQIQMGDGPSSLATLVGATIVSTYFAAGVTVTAANETTRVLTTSAAPTSVPAVVSSSLFEFLVTESVVTTTGADDAATFTGAGVVFDATLQVERSFDGGTEWIPCNIGGSGMVAQYTSNTPVSLAFGDAENAVLYRVNCLVFAAIAGVDLVYRISATGVGSTSISVPASM